MAVKIGPLFGIPKSALKEEITRAWNAGRNRMEQQKTARWIRG